MSEPQTMGDSQAIQIHYLEGAQYYKMQRTVKVITDSVYTL